MPSSPPATAPNGRLDRIKAGEKSITVQTEFFSNPNWKVETKIYVDGALKKLEAVPLDGTPEDQLQKLIDAHHDKLMQGLVTKLKAQQDGKGSQPE